MGEFIDSGCEVVRYASGGLVDGDTVTGGAFKPRPADEGLLSVNRLGICGEDAEDDLSKLRGIIASWMTVRKTGRLAQISARDIASIVQSAERTFHLEEDERKEYGKIDDPSHALIHGIPSSEDDGAIALRDMIAIAVSHLHPAVSDA